MDKQFRTSLDDKNNMIKLYCEEKLYTRKISELYNISPSAVVGILKRRGIKLNRTNYRKKYNNTLLNEDFFSDPNCEKSAYYAGFIASDGNIYKFRNKNAQKRLILEIHKKDIELLEKFDIGTDIIFRKNRETCSKAISSDKICEDLEKYGIIPNKTFLLTFPKNISDDYINHFIRGIFDGDGWFTVTKYGKVRGGIVGCYEFLQEIQNKLTFNTVLSKPKNKKYGILFINTSSIEDFAKYIYKNSTIFLPRKRNIVEHLI